MSGSAESPDAKRAGLYLAELLKQEPYKSRWDRPEWKMRARNSDLHHTAIAHVLADYLRVHPRESRKNDNCIEYSQLGPLVSNAVSGKRLGGETLQVFISAFQMRDEHADRLRRIHGGTSAIHVVPSESGVSLNTLATRGPISHATRYVQDHHYLGLGGLPYRHETFQVIEAMASGVDRYVYAFDTDHLTVEVLTGGKLSAPYVTLNRIHAIDIVFDRALGLGETHPLKYETTFRYESQPLPEFRRFSTARIEYAEVKVTFHPAWLPKRIWEADWDTLDGSPRSSRPGNLDKYYTVTRYLRDVRNSGFGFIWEWR